MPGESPRTIFIVDDDRGLLRLIEKALQRAGLSTATAASGKDAIMWLAHNRADLMLLDLKLEDIGGKDLISRLAEIKRSIPFIIITGQGDERAAVDMMKRGAVDYLVKGVDFLQFVPEVVQRALTQLEIEKRLGVAEEARKRLEEEILQISDLEQRRIGQDLHDGICQELAGIELMSQVLEQSLAKKFKAGAEQAARIAANVRAAISHTRDLARGLSPVVVESEGLMAALEELAASTESRFNVSCRFHCPLPVLVYDNNVATHLYRIAQEAVSNAIRHGKATRIEIALTKTPERISVAISDNGIGMPPDATTSKGMGLRIMQYRAGMIGGTLAVQPDLDGGTGVICSLQRPEGR
jgi:signal transduction histidine kinase